MSQWFNICFSLSSPSISSWENCGIIPIRDWILDDITVSSDLEPCFTLVHFFIWEIVDFKMSTTSVSLNCGINTFISSSNMLWFLSIVIEFIYLFYYLLLRCNYTYIIWNRQRKGEKFLIICLLVSTEAEATDGYLRLVRCPSYGFSSFYHGFNGLDGTESLNSLTGSKTKTGKPLGEDGGLCPAAMLPLWSYKS